MPEGIGFSAPGESLQRKARAWRLLTDQHGRVFGATVEVSNGHPVGELLPQGFSPPWLPPMEFAKFRGEHDVTFRWDYREMADRLSAQTAQYYQDAVKFALENNKPEPEVGGPVDRSVRYVLGVPPLSPAIPLSADMGDPWVLGIPDAPVNKILKAVLEQTAGADQREALGLIMDRLARQVNEGNIPMVPSTPFVPNVKEPARTINDEAPLEELPEITYPEFVKACRGRKMNMADIAAAWQQHKKDMAESVAA